jgi:hypothetical protein
MRIPYRLPSAFSTCSALLLAAGLSIAAAADSNPAPVAGSTAIVPPGKHAHKDCMADSLEISKLRLSVQEALKSGDKDKMKSALEMVDAHFAKMQDMMEQCKPGMKNGGAMMDHDGDMMCGKDHQEGGHGKSARHK